MKINYKKPTKKIFTLFQSLFLRIKSISFTNKLLIILIVLAFVGFYDSSAYFRTRINKIQKSFFNFFYSHEYKKIGDIELKCNLKGLETISFDKSDVVVETKKIFLIKIFSKTTYVKDKNGNRVECKCVEEDEIGKCKINFLKTYVLITPTPINNNKN